MALHATPHLFIYLALNLTSMTGWMLNFPGFAVWGERLPRSNLVEVKEIPFIWATIHTAPAMCQQWTNLYLQMLDPSTVSFDFLKVVMTSKNWSWASGGIVWASFSLRPGLMSSSRISGRKTSNRMIRMNWENGYMALPPVSIPWFITVLFLPDLWWPGWGWHQRNAWACHNWSLVQRSPGDQPAKLF